MKVSIITTTYNSIETIEETIQSVLAQTYSDIEYIIVDAGSTDGTRDIIEKYKAHIAKFIGEKDAGMYDAMNKGIASATGEIIGFLNSDDVYYDNSVIQTVVDALDKSKTEVCWGDMIYVKRNDLSKIIRVWKSSAYSTGLFQKGWHPPHPTFFARKSVYEKYGLFRTDLGLAADYELLLRLIEKYKVTSVYIPQFLVKMRVGGAGHWSNIFTLIKTNFFDFRSWGMNGLTVSPCIFFIKPFSKIQQLFRQSRT